MTKQVRKWLSGVGAGLAVLLLVGVAGVLTAGEASADTPPNPPARFTGTVRVDGQAPPAGTVVEARIGGNPCGSTSVFLVGTEARYVLDVPATDPGRSINCGTEGAVVEFYVGGKKAQQTGTWRNYQLNELNLTVVTPTPTPTATATPTRTPTRTPTPAAPRTGTGTAAGEEGSASLALAMFALGAVVLAGAGAVALRRSR